MIFFKKKEQQEETEETSDLSFNFEQLPTILTREIENKYFPTERNKKIVLKKNKIKMLKDSRKKHGITQSSL